MHPPVAKNGDSEKFKGRDWRSISVHEIIDPAEVRFVELDTSIEDTTKLLIKAGPPNVVLVRQLKATKTAISTFDYNDLNAYLLLVLGLTQPDEAASVIAQRARAGDKLPLKDVNDHLGPKEPPEFLPHTASLTQAMEVLGGGSHRLIICKEGTSEVVGVLSQLRLVRFFWENHLNFSAVTPLYGKSLTELKIGGKEVLAINGDKPLSDALQLMHNEGTSSLPVLDSHKNVIGNISHVDTRLLIDTSSIPLLSTSCIHFISVILSERGMNDGKDSYPVFHVTPFSTLAHTVAKLVATRSHRMWLVDAPSPASSVPASPSIHAHAVPPFSLTASTNGATTTGAPAPQAAVSAAQLPGQGMSGRISGVVSLTDILNLYAKASGLSPSDPEETRRRRRRTSSSSSMRPSIDSVRPSAEMMRGSGELPQRSTSNASSSRRGL